jgi:hypothetical protein
MGLSRQDEDIRSGSIRRTSRPFTQTEARQFAELNSAPFTYQHAPNSRCHYPSESR